MRRPNVFAGPYLDRAAHLRKDRADFGCRRLRRHTIGKPRDGRARVLIRTAGRRKRNPERGLRMGKLEARRHHSDDGVPAAIERDCLTENLRPAGEILLPSAMTEDDDRVRPGRLLVGFEDPAEPLACPARAASRPDTAATSASYDSIACSSVSSRRPNRATASGSITVLATRTGP